MKVLIIGYGSIGKRHESVLNSFKEIKKIDIVTKQNLDNKNTFYSIKKIENLDIYDYFIIASETNKHYEQLSYLESKVSKKIIFCEKPLYETKKELNIIKNKVYVGYVLRFHPLLQRLKKELVNEKIISININCGQYLPTWRTNIDYKSSYSAKKNEGGGVLLDLSHEIDYLQWLCGELEEIKSYQLKISDLEIDSDDVTTLIGQTKNNILVNLSIDYISKILNRKILIHTLDKSFELDFILNKLIINNKKDEKEEIEINSLERNYMFEQMHKDILNKCEYICNYDEGINVMKTISNIQEQNL